MTTQASYKELRKKHRESFKLNGTTPLRSTGYDQIHVSLTQASALLTALAITLPEAKCGLNDRVLAVALDGIGALVDQAIYELDLEFECN